MFWWRCAKLRVRVVVEIGFEDVSFEAQASSGAAYVYGLLEPGNGRVFFAWKGGGNGSDGSGISRAALRQVTRSWRVTKRRRAVCVLKHKSWKEGEWGGRCGQPSAGV